MDVVLRPPFHGCLIALVNVMTCGVHPIARRIMERRFIRCMDETGLETRGGRRVAWTDVKNVRRVVTKVQGVRMSDEYLMRSSRGKISLPLWRIEKPQAARDFLLRHLPPGVL